MTARVAEIWRYRVKSMQGERIQTGLLSEFGLDGDRQWALRDVAHDKLVSAKQNRDTLHASACMSDGGIQIRLPDGQVLTGMSTGVNAALSAWLGREVELVEASAQNSLTYDYYIDPENEQGEVVQIPSADGAFLDAGAVHILSTASLRAIAATAPGSDWDLRRFRPTLLVDAGSAEGYIEDDWVGHFIEVGEARLSVLMPTIRCGMPGRSQPGLNSDTDVVRRLKSERGMLLGVYATVDRAGIVTEGDPLILEPAN